jgi:hypothetical protein
MFFQISKFSPILGVTRQERMGCQESQSSALNFASRIFLDKIHGMPTFPSEIYVDFPIFLEAIGMWAHSSLVILSICAAALPTPASILAVLRIRRDTIR